MICVQSKVCIQKYNYTSNIKMYIFCITSHYNFESPRVLPVHWLRGVFPPGERGEKAASQLGGQKAWERLGEEVGVFDWREEEGLFPTFSDLIIFDHIWSQHFNQEFHILFVLMFDMVEVGVVFDRETLKKGCFLIFWTPTHWHVADRLVRYKGEIYGDGFNLQTAMMLLLLLVMMMMMMMMIIFIIITIIIIITMTIIIIWWWYWWWWWRWWRWWWRWWRSWWRWWGWWWWWWWWRWSYFFSWFDPIHWIGTDSMDPFRREYFRHHKCAH